MNSLSERDTVDKTMVDDDESIARAEQTILALSALLGDASSSFMAKLSLKDNCKQPAAADHADSVATWGKQNSQVVQVSKPSIECPPYTDPSSILIADSRTLEYELEEEPLALVKPTATASTDNNSVSSTGSKVRFHSHVRVVEIPSHRDMDLSVVNSIWTSVDDVQENARRNAFEYHADGRDWTKVTEEHDMIWDDVTQELLHPATYEDLQVERMHQAHAADQRQRRQEALQKLIMEQRQQSQDGEATDMSPPTSSKSLQAQTQQMVVNTTPTKQTGKRRTSPRQQRRKQHPQPPKQQAPKGARVQQRRAVASLTRFADT